MRRFKPIFDLQPFNALEVPRVSSDKEIHPASTIQVRRRSWEEPVTLLFNLLQDLKERIIRFQRSSRMSPRWLRSQHSAKCRSSFAARSDGRGASQKLRRFGPDRLKIRGSQCPDLFQNSLGLRAHDLNSTHCP